MARLGIKNILILSGIHYSPGTHSMRSGLSVIAAAALVCLSSCSKAEIDFVSPGMEMQTITVKIGIDTKTTLNDAHNRLEWSDTDAIGVLNRVTKTANEKLKYEQGGEITMTIPASADRIYGYYPYAAGTTTEKYNNNINDGELQEAAGSLNGINTPMFAFSNVIDSKAELIFKPVSGLLALNIYSASGVSTYGKIKSVTVKTGSIACAGASTADLTATDSPVFTGTKTSTRTAMLTPCDVLGTAPADEASIGTFPNQIYVNVAKKIYSEGMTFEIRTDAATNNLYTISTSKVYDLTATDLQFININLDKSVPSTETSDTFVPESCDESDLLAVYLTGGDIEICGQKVSMKTAGRYTSLRPCDLRHFDFTKSLSETGVIFLDNTDTTASVNTYISESDSRFGQDAIYIGRRTDRPQPTIKAVQTDESVSTKFLLLAGKNMFKNIRLHMDCTLYRARDGYCGLSRWTGLPRSVPCELYMDGCTFISDAGYGGFYRQINDKGPKFIRCDNSIIACTNDFITGKVGEGMEAAISDFEEISFNNCILCHANSDYGRLKGGMLELVAFRYGNNPRSDKLRISIDHCTVYNIHPTAYGFFQLNSVKSVDITNCVFCAENLPYTQGTSRPMISLYNDSSSEAVRTFNYNANYRESRSSEKSYIWNMDPDEVTAKFFTSWTVAGDMQIYRDSMFSVEDKQNYRFVINRSRVPNAGADCNKIPF